MEQVNICIPTDAVLKRDFERLCRDVGLDINTVLTMLMKQSVRKHELPLSMKGDKYRITEEELLRRIARVEDGYYVEKTIEELDVVEDA